MKTALWYLSIVGTVGIAVLADTIATIWAHSENKLSIHLFFLCILGPLVFMTFGYVTTKTGLSIASGVINSLLVVSSISVGLLFFQEWNKLSTLQYVGMALAITGIILMLFYGKEAS